MRKTLDALLWICVGAQIAFVLSMQAMNDVLADTSTITNAAVASNRADFFNVQWWSMVVTIVVAAADVIVRWRDRKVQAA